MPKRMEPEHLRFGGGATETMLNPLVAVWMLIAIVLILTLPRRAGSLHVFFCLSLYPGRTSRGVGRPALYGAAHPDFGRIGSKGH